MIQINCMIATPEIREMAAKLGKSVVVTTNAVATWLSENNTAIMPNLEQIKKLFELAELEHKDYYLAVPNAIVTPYEKEGAPITHLQTNNKIIMMLLPSANTLEHFYNTFSDIPELKTLVLEPQEAYWFMLWRELQFITNGWEKTPENINKANKEALDRLKLYKKQNPHTNLKLSDAHHNVVKAINDYINWANEHVKFNEETHTYYIDGVPADFSVSQYYESIYADSPNFGDTYAESPAIGNTMDAVWRDYFDDTERSTQASRIEYILSKEYPNINASRKNQILRDLDRFKSYLDARFGVGLYKVITNPNFHLVARMGDKVIAGTPDMVIIDKDGNPHLFDMKAKSHPITQTYNGQIVNDARNYTAQLNLYRAMMEVIPSVKKLKSLLLIWMDTNITSMRHNGNSFNVDKLTEKVTVSNEKLGIINLPIETVFEWNTPSLNSMDVSKSIISLGIQPKVRGLIIPNMERIDYGEEPTFDVISNIEQVLDNLVSRKDIIIDSSSSRLAGYNSKTGIVTLKSNNYDRNEVLNHFKGESGLPYSDLKKRVLLELFKNGWPIERIEAVLSTDRAATLAIVLHEIYHKYYKDKYDVSKYMSPKAIAIETRATLKALEILEQYQKNKNNQTMKQQILPNLMVTESTGDYAQRTKENAEWADVTLALATDFSTAGETLTAQQAGSKDPKYLGNRKPIEGVKDKYLSSYLPVGTIQDITGLSESDNTKKQLIQDGPSGYNAKSLAEELINQWEKKRLPTKDIKLNIAGNGIYTLNQYTTQEELNQYVTDFIRTLLDNGITISEIRSGGQTGVDEAGIIAAQRLGIKASVHAPRGFKFRGIDGKDISDKDKFLARFNQNETVDNKVQIHQGNWSRQEAQNNPNILYVFTDNTDRDSGSGRIPDDSWYSKKYGIGHHFPTMTAAVIRGLNNARPISTQRWYHQGAKGETGRWTDADIEEFKPVIRDELQEIVNEFNTGKYDTIMFPDGDGLFNTRISNITKQRTPQLYQALSGLLHEFGFDSLIPKDISTIAQLPFDNSIANTEVTSTPNVPKYVETTNYLPYSRPDVTIDRSNFTIKETPQAKLAREFSPNERTLRVEGIARDFSRAIDNASKKLISDLEKKLQESRDAKDYSKTLRILSDLELLKDEKNGRKEVVERYTPKQLAIDVLQEYKDIANMTPEKADDTYGKGKGVEIISKAQKVVDNFYPLLDEATIQIEWYEGFRLIYEDANDSTVPRGAVLAKPTEEQDAEDREFGDDEDGKRINGSEGWSFQVRFINPHSTVTNRVKKIISNILYQGANGLENDDLGKPRYMPEVIVYGTLINELINMSSSDDFAVKNEDGNYTFPALEAMLPKFPWVEQIIIELEDNPQMISQFYAAFRKEFIPYWMQYFDRDNNRVTYACNRTLAEDNIIGDLYAMYNKGLNDSNIPIYNILGEPIKESAARLQILISKVYSILDSFNASQKEDLAEYLYEINLSLGIKVDKSLTKGITESDAAEGVIRKWANAANKIIQDIIDEKVPRGAHIIEHFKDQYKTIAETIGTVSELANVLSFREGDKSYYSISASNFLYTTIKKFKKDNFKDYIDTEFKQFRWFYNEKLGGWLNGWVEELLENSETRNQLEIREHVFYKDQQGKLKEYNQWTPQDIEDIFLTEYWSIPKNQSTTKQYAMFNLPIPSDSEQALFIKFSKFSGAHYQDRIIEGLRKVVLQELTRIKLVRDRLAKKAPEIMYFDKNGLKFQFFPRFNDLKVLDEWLPYLDKEDIEGLNTAIRKTLRSEMETQWEEYKKNSKLDKEGLKKYLVQQGTMKESEDVDTYIEEYYWNNAYAQTQILQLTIIDPALYKNGNDLQKRFKEIIASGTKLFTNSKYGRKIERTIYLKDQIGISSTYNNIKEILEKAVKLGHIQTYDRDNILYLFRDVNATDAQAYRTSSSYRAVIDMLQGWSDEMESAIQHFKNGNWNMADFNIVWQTLKPFMFTHIPKDAGIGTGEKIKVGHQNKNSEFLLLAMYNLVSQSMGKSDKIVALNEFMETYNIDVAQFISAVKTGGETVVDITYYPPALEAVKYDTQGNESSNWKEMINILTKEKSKEKVSKMSDIDIYRESQELMLIKGIITQEEYNRNMEELEPTKEEVIELLEQQVLNEDKSFKENVVHELPYEDYVIQQPTPEHLFDVESVFGSQFRNLITSDLPEDFTMNINGTILNKEQVLRLYQGCIVENLLEDYKDLKDEFSNIESLQKMLMSQIKGNAKYGRDMLNALEIVEYIDPRDGKVKKTFNIPLNAPNITDVLQELLLSCFKNHITKQRIKGGACIAVSNFGFTNELKIHYNKEGDKTSGIAYMDCYLPWYSKKYFEPFIKEVTKTIEVNGRKKTVTYQELDYESMPEELKYIIGFRIPTEAKYSMFPLRIAGFLPQQNGSSIMLPMEATTLSGMDFKL